MWIELVKDFLGQKAGQRIDVADADARALVAAGTARDVQGDPLVEAVQKSMAEALSKITGSIGSAVDSAMKEFAAARTRSRRHQVPAIFGEGGQGDPARTFGAYLIAVKSHDLKALEEMGSHYVEW